MSCLVLKRKFFVTLLILPFRRPQRLFCQTIAAQFCHTSNYIMAYMLALLSLQE